MKSGDVARDRTDSVRPVKPSKLQNSSNPSTSNPTHEELVFVAADENRDIGARLDQYAMDSASGEVIRLGLIDAFRAAQSSGREFKSAEEQYILAAIQLLIERHQWGPRLFNDTTASINSSGNDGNFDTALTIVNELRASKRLPYGGAVEARWIWSAAEKLRENATDRYSQSSRIVLSGEIPLLRGAGTAAREDLIQAERNLVYQARIFERFRRSLIVDIAGDYFDLVQTRARIRNQEEQLKALITLEAATDALVNAGRKDAFQRGVASSRVLAGRAALEGLREQYNLQVDRFKIRLGYSPDTPIEITGVDLELPDPEIGMPEATRRALEYRLDLQNRRDQVADARRNVARAKNSLLPDLDLTGNITLPTDPDERVGGLSFDPDDATLGASIRLSAPLDRETERLGLRSATIRFQQRLREYEQARDDVVVRVRSALRSVEVARVQLTLAEQQVKINERRLVGQRLKQDSLDPQVLVDSLNDLLESANNRDRALADLRKAILDYLLESDQLRVARDGSFQTLPGMQ